MPARALAGRPGAPTRGSEPERRRPRRVVRRDRRPPPGRRGVRRHRAPLASARSRSSRSPTTAPRIPGSTTELRELRPRIAVISCGRDNDYGHPRPETLAALAGSPGLAVYRTDEDGRVVVESDGARAHGRDRAVGSVASPTRRTSPSTCSPEATARRSRLRSRASAGTSSRRRSKSSRRSTRPGDAVVALCNAGSLFGDARLVVVEDVDGATRRRRSAQGRLEGRRRRGGRRLPRQPGAGDRARARRGGAEDDLGALEGVREGGRGPRLRRREEEAPGVGRGAVPPARRPGRARGGRPR